MESPSILVACKIGIESGCSKGIWIDMSDSISSIETQISDYLSQCCDIDCNGAKEWVVIDSHGFFGTEFSKEIPDLKFINELAVFLQRYGKLGALVFREADHDLDEAREIIRNQYYGQYKDVKSFLISLAQESYGISDDGVCYLDLNRLENDLFPTDFFHVADCRSIHVFKFT